MVKTKLIWTKNICKNTFCKQLLRNTKIINLEEDIMYLLKKNNFS